MSRVNRTNNSGMNAAGGSTPGMAAVPSAGQYGERGEGVASGAEGSAFSSGGVGGAGRLVGESPAMGRLRKLVKAVAMKDCTVLVRGESGTGKELIARTVHEESRRATGPFVAVDCTGLRDTLLESQLFGHVKGAFTGAEQNTLGFIRAADGGTLFLDEIGELEPKTQAKLLRVIQERSVVPLGSVKPIPVNVRILAATHRDLKKMVTHGQFREDLYFRLDVVTVHAPTLGERKTDIVLLAEHFLKQVAELYEEPVKSISPEARKVLEAYAWPGNVRELANAIEHAVVFCKGSSIDVLDLPERVRGIGAGNAGAALDLADGPIITLEAAEKGLIVRALKASNGNQSRAAALLSIDRRRLYRKVRLYGLNHLVSASSED
ncbi:MAG: sigma-54-dependent Fis family transcriptional regulator [Phycisphaerales bacterium]|nr:sigma-54-dependent Fis family transcriptional regulator [Phycisphaerales bacterium]